MSPLDMVVGDPAFWSTPQQVLYMPARRRRTPGTGTLCAPNAVPSTVPLADREMLNVTDHGAIVDEVEAAYRHYVEVFNRRDATEVAKLYDRPHAQVSGEIGLSIVNDDADQQQWYEFVMAYLDDQGWGRTEIDEMWIWPLSLTLAQLVASVTRYRSDGSVLNHARANYTLRRRDSTWKVVLSFPLLENAFDVPVWPAASH